MLPSFDAMISLLTGLGNGTMRVQLRTLCQTCDATGMKTTYPLLINGTDYITDTCPDCKGEKYIWQTMEVK